VEPSILPFGLFLVLVFVIEFPRFTGRLGYFGEPDAVEPDPFIPLVTIAVVFDVVLAVFGIQNFGGIPGGAPQDFALGLLGDFRRRCLLVLRFPEPDPVLANPLIPDVVVVVVLDVEFALFLF